MNTLRVCLLAVAVTVFSCNAPAQEPSPPMKPQAGPHAGAGPFGPQRGPGGERARELLEQVFVARLSRKLELNDEQALLMMRRYSDHREHTQNLREQRREVAAQLKKRMMEDKASPEVGALLTHLEEIDRDIVNSRFEVYQQLCEGLNPAQRAELYLFITDFEQDMRGWVNQLQRRRFLDGGEPLVPGEMGPGDGFAPDSGTPGRGQGRRPSPRGPVPPAMPAMPAAPDRPTPQFPLPPPR